MSCDILSFSRQTEVIEGNWSAWNLLIEKMPTTFGISFGSTFTTCGSLGVKGLYDVTPVLSFGLLTPTFSACGTRDIAVLIVPFSGELEYSMEYRATSTVHLFAEHNEGSAKMNINGNLLIIADAVGGELDFGDNLSVDIAASVRFPDPASFTDNGNPFYTDAFPVNEFVTAYQAHLNEYLKANVKTLISSLQSRNSRCTMPAMPPKWVPGSDPVESCHPCDLGCLCFVRQSCNDGCLTCGTVECASSALTSSVPKFAFTVIALAISVHFLWMRYLHATSK